ncbi:hypothetical protein A3K73_00175 [Candidatus Pacearchaeota archaeon RBG_13_36_9]|nr:MAG: hypothetical protein A3K73_00175 [Candidatus Pacearchaeota archaeon RBG_13_36_9]
MEETKENKDRKPMPKGLVALLVGGGIMILLDGFFIGEHTGFSKGYKTGAETTIKIFEKELETASKEIAKVNEEILILYNQALRDTSQNLSKTYSEKSPGYEEAAEGFREVALTCQRILDSYKDPNN